jgi:hypothetical protein
MRCMHAPSLIAIPMILSAALIVFLVLVCLSSTIASLAVRKSQSKRSAPLSFRDESVVRMQGAEGGGRAAYACRQRYCFPRTFALTALASPGALDAGSRAAPLTPFRDILDQTGLYRSGERSFSFAIVRQKLVNGERLIILHQPKQSFTTSRVYK